MLFLLFFFILSVLYGGSRRRIRSSQYVGRLRAGGTVTRGRTYKRRRYNALIPGFGINRNRFRFTPRSLGNPMAVTERKYFDNERVATVPFVSSDWSGTLLNPVTANTLFSPSQGNGINQRIGRQVSVVRLAIHGNCGLSSFYGTGLSPKNGFLIRIVLFIDQQTNGVIASAPQVIGSGTSIDPIDMFQNYDNFGRFRVLKDVTFKFDYPSVFVDSTSTNFNGQSIVFKWNFKFNPPLRIRFNATNNGTVADIVTNNFAMMAGTTNSVVGQSFLDYKVRTVYYDC